MSNSIGEQKPRSTYRTSKYISSTTPEEYFPMEVPEHIYVTGVEPKPAQKESRPQMVVPGRITVEGGDKMVASKSQPTEILSERQTHLPTMENEVGISISGIPDTLTANELPHEDATQYTNSNSNEHTPENPYYASQTSIDVDTNPIKELKLMRRKLNKLIKRVENLEQECCDYHTDKPYIFAGAGFLFAGILVIYFVCRK